MIHINTATPEELKKIPGVGDKIAASIIRMREIYGVIKKDALSFLLKGTISQEVYNMIDFSEAKPDPFDFNFANLPSVPKSAVWEPLKSFTDPTTTSEQIQQPHMWML